MSNAVFAEEEPFYTYTDYKNWELVPGERYELIDSVAYAMVALNAYYQAISMELSAQFHVFFSYAASLARSIPLPTTCGCFMRKTRATTP